VDEKSRAFRLAALNIFVTIVISLLDFDGSLVYLISLINGTTNRRGKTVDGLLLGLG
jgi:hypothetical protein